MNRKIGTALVAGLAIFLGAGCSTSSLTTNTSNAAANSNQAAANSNQTVQYTVTSNGSQADVDYNTTGNQGEQNLGASMPWSKTVTLQSGDRYYVSAQAQDGTEVKCTVRENGKIVDSQVSTGQFTIVTCNGDV